MAEIVRLRPYGTASKDQWKHFPTGGTLAERTNKNKTHEETPGTTEGIETLTTGEISTVKAGVEAAAYKLPEGAQVLKCTLWVYGKAGSSAKDVKIEGKFGSATAIQLKLEETPDNWHSVAKTKAEAEALTAKNLEEAQLSAESVKTIGSVDKVYEWHIELEVETSGITKLAASTTIKLATQALVAITAALGAQTKVSFSDTATVTMRANLAATSKVTVASTAATATRVGIQAQTTVRFTGSAQAAIVWRLAASTSVHVATAAAATPTSSLTAATIVRFATAAAVAPQLSLKAVTRIRIAGTVTFPSARGAKATGLAGVANPSMRSGRVLPSQRIGVSSPQAAHEVPLFPSEA